MRNISSGPILITLAVGLFFTFALLSQDRRPDLLKEVPQNRTASATPEEANKLRRLQAMSTTKSVRLVSVNRAALDASEFDVNIPDLGEMKVTKTGGAQDEKHNGTWFGKLHGPKPGTVTLVMQDGEVTGSISSSAGVFRIVPIGSELNALVTIDSRKFPPDEPPDVK